MRGGRGLLSTGLFLAVATAHGQQPAPSAPPLVADPARLATVSRDLATQLRSDPFVYFRFVNREWTERVCQAFADEIPALAPTQLHGDAHVEQYALTATEYGLDDFDDSTLGPVVVDLVRFTASLELAARERGWQPWLDRLADSFFDGYRRGLGNPAKTTGTPRIVRRLRAGPARHGGDFLAWADSLMRPLTAEQVADIEESLQLVVPLYRRFRPGLAPGFFTVKRAGWLGLGVGSAVTPKILIRVEGATADAADDVIVEAKKVGSLYGVSCLELPRSREVMRVVRGTEQIGRMHHEVLSVVPAKDGGPGSLSDWWIRSWDATYAEVRVRDFETLDELAEVARDAGEQLGAAGLRERQPSVQRALRSRQRQAVDRLEGRIRETARTLVVAMLGGWNALRESR